MQSVLRNAVLTVIMAASFATPLLAQQDDHHVRKPLDPNEVVCERETVVGSRLAVRRTCLTRSQWAEQRRLERETVERTQTQLCVAKGGSCVGPS